MHKKVTFVIDLLPVKKSMDGMNNITLVKGKHFRVTFRFFELLPLRINNFFRKFVVNSEQGHLKHAVVPNIKANQINKPHLTTVSTSKEMLKIQSPYFLVLSDCWQ